MRSIVLAAALLMSSIALAGPQRGGPMSIDELAAALALDESQAAQVDQILGARHERMRSLRELDRSERRAGMQRIRQETREQLQTVLTADQLRTFDELHAGRRGPGKRGREHRTDEL